jgi:hypothetical protein
MIKVKWLDANHKSLIAIRKVVAENRTDIENCHAALVAEKECEKERAELQAQFETRPTPALARKLAALHVEISGLRAAGVRVCARAHAEAYSRVAARTRPALAAALEYGRECLAKEKDTLLADIAALQARTGKHPDERAEALADADRIFGMRLGAIDAKLAAISTARGQDLAPWAAELAASIP